MHQPPLQVAIRQINGRASLSVLEFNAAWSARWSKPSENFNIIEYLLVTNYRVAHNPRTVLTFRTPR